MLGEDVMSRRSKFDEHSSVWSNIGKLVAILSADGAAIGFYGDIPTRLELSILPQTLSFFLCFLSLVGMRFSTRDTSDLASEQAAEVRAKVTPSRDRAVALFRVSLEIARSLTLRQRPEFSRRIKIQVQVESTWVLKDTSSPRGFFGESLTVG